MGPMFSPEAMSNNFEAIVKRSLNKGQEETIGLDTGIETGYLSKLSPPSDELSSPQRKLRTSPRARARGISGGTAGEEVKGTNSKNKDQKKKDQKYLERRRKNNLAAHKSRLKVKMRQQQIAEDNKKLLL